MLEAFLVGIIDAFLLRKTMQFYSGVDRRRRDGKQSAEAVRKIDALDDTLSTGSRFSLRSFAAWTATKNAAKSLT